MKKDTRPRPPRQTLLALSYADQYIEYFGDNVDVCHVRVPAAFSREAEAIAEDVVDLLLASNPKTSRFRPLYDRSKLVKNGTTRPLLPSTLRRSIDVQECLALFDMMATTGESRGLLWS